MTRTRTALVAGAALLAAAAVALTATDARDTATVPVAVTAPAVEDEGPGTERVPAAVEDEGPGTERVPAAVEDEGPGTERVPGTPDEGPGTADRPSPVYGSSTPATWKVVVPHATVYAVPGDTASRTGATIGRTADVAGTGRTATVGRTPWVEVKVAGASTGWVVGTELERL